jgi:4-amino-4-deoxy-L-arabinose transferase-like glycosyltransferase
MIQRIQTIYLLLASIVSGGLIFVFNLWNTIKEKIFVVDLFSREVFTLKVIPFMFIMSAILSLVAIFLFKNRKLQFVIGRIIILTNFFLLGLLIYLSLNLSGETSVSEKGIGMFLPILAILLVVLANKAIKKDEDLIKSVDRLR